VRFGIRLGAVARQSEKIPEMKDADDGGGMERRRHRKPEHMCLLLLSYCGSCWRVSERVCASEREEERETGLHFD